MNEVWLIIGMTLVTFGVRYPILALFGRLPLPDPIFRGLKYVPPAVLPAIIVPATVYPQGTQLVLGLENEYLVASILAAFVAWRSKNLLITILAGMLALWGLRWIL